MIKTGNIQEIIESGVSGILESSIPPRTFPAWKCYSTGKNPGKLGVFDFFKINLDQRRANICDSRSFDGLEIWDIMSRKGKIVCVINMPTTFPPKRVNGVLIGGPFSAKAGYTYPREIEKQLKLRYNYTPFLDQLYFETNRNTAIEKGKGEFIFGLRLKEEEFDVPVLPTRWDLDEACSENPIFILRYDSHIGIANSKALELFEFNSETKVPKGGEIRENEAGELTGIISENALDLIYSKISKFLIPESDAIQETADKAFILLAKKGITSLHGIIQLGVSGEGGDLGLIEIPIFKSVQEKILQNWYGLISTDKPKKLIKIKKPPLDGGKEDSKFKIGCLKLFLDGQNFILNSKKRITNSWIEMGSTAFPDELK